MSEDNREHWSTISRSAVIDALVKLGVPDKQAHRMEHKAAVREWRRRQERVDVFTNCDIGTLIEDMIAAGVALVEKDRQWKLSVPTVQAERWVDAVKPALTFRKDELIEAWQARQPPDFRVCAKCLAQVFDAEYEGVGCSSIFSCPFRKEKS